MNNITTVNWADGKTILEYAKEHEYSRLYCVHHESGKICNGFTGNYEGYFYDAEYSCEGSYEDFLKHHESYGLYDIEPNEVYITEDEVFEMVLIFEHGQIDEPLEYVVSQISENGPEGYGVDISVEYKNYHG